MHQENEQQHQVHPPDPLVDEPLQAPRSDTGPTESRASDQRLESELKDADIEDTIEAPKHEHAASQPTEPRDHASVKSTETRLPEMKIGHQDDACQGESSKPPRMTWADQMDDEEPSTSTVLREHPQPAPGPDQSMAPSRSHQLFPGRNDQIYVPDSERRDGPFQSLPDRNDQSGLSHPETRSRQSSHHSVSRQDYYDGGYQKIEWGYNNPHKDSLARDQSSHARDRPRSPRGDYCRRRARSPPPASRDHSSEKADPIIRITEMPASVYCSSRLDRWRDYDRDRDHHRGSSRRKQCHKDKANY